MLDKKVEFLVQWKSLQRSSNSLIDTDSHYTVKFENSNRLVKCRTSEVLRSGVCKGKFYHEMKYTKLIQVSANQLQFPVDDSS